MRAVDMAGFDHMPGAGAITNRLEAVATCSVGCQCLDQSNCTTMTVVGWLAIGCVGVWPNGLAEVTMKALLVVVAVLVTAACSSTSSAGPLHASCTSGKAQTIAKVTPWKPKGDIRVSIGV
jgi:hypothetical protein